MTESSVETPMTAPSIEFAGSGDSHLVFSGPPQRLSGTIPLVNTGSEKQKLRNISVVADDLRGAASQPLEQVSFYAKLYPGEQASVPGTIVLDSTTPPGKYDMQVKVGEKTMSATAHVSEVVDLRVQPTQITILADTATSYAKQFVVENAGNVDLPSGSRCEGPIFESYDLVPALIMGLHKADQSSAESLAKGFLTEWGKLQAGMLVITRDSIVLEPGQKQSVDLTFQLPPELKPLRHYQAVVQLYNASVSVSIYTTGKYGSGK